MVASYIGNKKGGLGLRSVSKHSPAAYLSSRSSCYQLCRQLDPDHIWEGDLPSSTVHKAAMAVNDLAGSVVVPPDRVPPDLKQRVLSTHIDDGTLTKLKDPQKKCHFPCTFRIGSVGGGWGLDQRGPQ